MDSVRLTDEKRVRLVAHVTPELKKLVEGIALELGVSASTVITLALKEYARPREDK